MSVAEALAGDPIGLLLQIPLAGVVIYVVAMFLRHIKETERSHIQTQDQMAKAIDRNTEAIGRNSGALERMDNFLNKPEVQDLMNRI